jgi:hypothetical protein
VLAAKHWHDYEFLQQEFLRLASIHRQVIVIWPDDTDRWQLEIHDWCKKNPEQFIAHPYRKNLAEVGYGEDTDRDWRMFWDELPDEVWKIESTKNFARRPTDPVWPHLWDMAQASNMTCLLFSAPRKRNTSKPLLNVRKRKIRPS